MTHDLARHLDAYHRSGRGRFGDYLARQGDVSLAENSIFKVVGYDRDGHVVGTAVVGAENKWVIAGRGVICQAIDMEAAKKVLRAFGAEALETHTI